MQSSHAGWRVLALLPAGSPLDLVANETLRNKMQEPLNLLGKQRFANIDIRVRAKGGGHVSQAYGEQGRLLCQLPAYGHSLPACCSDLGSGASAVCMLHLFTQRHLSRRHCQPCCCAAF